MGACGRATRAARSGNARRQRALRRGRHGEVATESLMNQEQIREKTRKDPRSRDVPRSRGRGCEWKPWTWTRRRSRIPSAQRTRTPRAAYWAEADLLVADELPTAMRRRGRRSEMRAGDVRGSAPFGEIRQVMRKGHRPKTGTVEYAHDELKSALGEGHIPANSLAPRPPGFAFR